MPPVGKTEKHQRMHLVRINLEKSFDYILRHDTVCKNNFINVMQTPRVQNLSFNIGVGDKAVTDRKQVIPALFALELVTGQRPNITRARKSIDKFGLRRQMPIGAKVTSRGKNMYSFLGECINPVTKMPILTSGYLRNFFGTGVNEGGAKRGGGGDDLGCESAPGLITENAWQTHAPDSLPNATVCVGNETQSLLSLTKFGRVVWAQHHGSENKLKGKKSLCAPDYVMDSGAEHGNTGSVTVGIPDLFVFKSVERQYSKFDTLYGADLTVRILNLSPLGWTPLQHLDGSHAPWTTFPVCQPIGDEKLQILLRQEASVLIHGHIRKKVSSSWNNLLSGIALHTWGANLPPKKAQKNNPS
uniref:50S ribosomal protein L5 n=1 Tax=Marophrys sp. SRT127 TaxID=2488311 RepID=A0A455RED2_9EUKA|nr:50S ribosomal protein L5 [Marophrys sp. SRT127]